MTTWRSRESKKLDRRVAHRPTPSGEPLLRSATTAGTVLMVALLSIDCSRDTESERVALLDLPLLRAKSEVVALLPAEGWSVVLVYSPEQCFTCDADISEWIRLHHERLITVAVVLTRSPTIGEAAVLARLRVPVVGVLAASTEESLRDSPQVIAFAARDREIAHAGMVSAAARSRILSSLLDSLQQTRR